MELVSDVFDVDPDTWSFPFKRAKKHRRSPVFFIRNCILKQRNILSTRLHISTQIPLVLVMSMSISYYLTSRMFKIIRGNCEIRRFTHHNFDHSRNDHSSVKARPLCKSLHHRPEKIHSHVALIILPHIGFLFGFDGVAPL